VEVLMMKKLKFKEPYNHYFEYKSDIDRIVKIFADRGYEISHTDAVHAWEQFSDSMCAGWMCLGDDDEVFSDAFSYFEEVE
jgi:hypothetical protein